MFICRKKFYSQWNGNECGFLFSWMIYVRFMDDREDNIQECIVLGVV